MGQKDLFLHEFRLAWKRTLKLSLLNPTHAQSHQIVTKLDVGVIIPGCLETPIN
jgi:hypothetical protein